MGAHIKSDQTEILWYFFTTNQYPTKSEKEELAHKTDLSLQKVAVWFNNQRVKQRISRGKTVAQGKVEHEGGEIKQEKRSRNKKEEEHGGILPPPSSKCAGEPEKLPWCVICNEDAPDRCLGCGGDFFCSSCYKEFHVGEDPSEHRAEKYKRWPHLENRKADHEREEMIQEKRSCNKNVEWDVLVGCDECDQVWTWFIEMKCQLWCFFKSLKWILRVFW